MASIRLVVNEAKEEKVFLLAGEDAIVGRSDQGDIVLDNAGVSGRHGLFKAGMAGYTYTDLGSTNGSALQPAGGGTPEPVRAGQVVPLAPGAILLLGSQDEAVRIEIHEGAAPFKAGAGGSRTVVSRVPLTNLLPVGPEELANLAARAISSASGRALAEAGLSFLRAQFPGAAAHCVLVCGAGFSERVGSALPSALEDIAKECECALVIEDDAGNLPTSGSVARVGVRAAVVCPLLAGGGWHGYLLAWTPLDSSVFPTSTVKNLSVAASLVALGAQGLATRLEGELERERLAAQLKGLGVAAGGLGAVVEPIGRSPSFLAALELSRAVARSDVSVLLNGETGTGKEVVARSIHRWSQREKKSFVAFNCAAVPESLVESELFGHVRGSFTGANADRPGLFEEADGGTIFLDEIGEMPAVMQAKLLRVLQDGELRPVGSSKVKKVDVRVLSATHQDLPALVEAGKFRADLMYRLNAVTVEIPPIRSRGDDILLLAHHLLGKQARRAQKKIGAMSQAVVSLLARYPWPGNVRELENEIARAVALTHDGSSLEPSAFSPKLSALATQAVAVGGGDAGTLKEAVERAEIQAVRIALQSAGDNVSQAARILGLSRPGLYKLMERLGLR